MMITTRTLQSSCYQHQKPIRLMRLCLGSHGLGWSMHLLTQGLKPCSAVDHLSCKDKLQVDAEAFWRQFAEPFTLEIVQADCQIERPTLSRDARALVRGRQCQHALLGSLVSSHKPHVLQTSSRMLQWFHHAAARALDPCELPSWENPCSRGLKDV